VSLESRLELLRQDIQFPEPPDFSSTIATSIGPRYRPARWRRPILLAAAAIALFLIVALAVPESRTALANWLGLGGIRIEVVNRLLDRDDRVEIDSSLIVGEQIRMEDAYLASAHPLAGLPGIAPVRAYERLDGPAKTISLIYEPSESLPEIGDTGVGALLMQIETPGEFIFIVKESRASEWSTFVQIGATDGYWVQSGNLIATPYDPEGMFGLETVSRSTGNVLLWQVDGVTYRLETNLSRAEAIALAESLVPISSTSELLTHAKGTTGRSVVVR
jgi:hypothetical protein